MLLIATIALLMPRGPAPGGFHDAAPVVRADGEGGAQRYAVVLDAGSTGSRVHAFAFAEALGGGLDLLSDTFEQLKPGLSSFAADPAGGAASLKPLLDAAVAAVPAAARASTPVQLRATAGLRMLPGVQADNLLSGAPPRCATQLPPPRPRAAWRLRAAPAPTASATQHTRMLTCHTAIRHAAVRELLGEYPFRFSEGSVSIMGGADEGAFQWLTLNYLLGNLGGGIEARSGTPAALSRARVATRACNDTSESLTTRAHTARRRTPWRSSTWAEAACSWRTPSATPWPLQRPTGACELSCAAVCFCIQPER